jgi:hypothetical protein
LFATEISFHDDGNRTASTNLADLCRLGGSRDAPHGLQSEGGFVRCDYCDHRSFVRRAERVGEAFEVFTCVNIYGEYFQRRVKSIGFE